MTASGRRNTTVAACAALSAVLGTVHAFSVFVPEWEQIPGANRASVSLVYSMALVALTVAVLAGHRIYRRLSPPVVMLIAGIGAGAGLILSAHSDSLFLLYLTYGLVFGSANGVGYGYALQLAGQAVSAHRGVAMGLVTAFYAVGATVAPMFFLMLITRGGNAMALTAMGMVALFVSVFAALLVRWAGASYQGEAASDIQPLALSLQRTRLLLWVGYGSAVAAGLMIIGHAYGIAYWLRPRADLSEWSPTIVALGNTVGGFSAGYYADRLSSGALLRWLPVISAAGLLLLLKLTADMWLIAAIGFGLVGYSYGAIIAVFPVAVADLYGAQAAPRIYGQLFTAWGLAGLLGPWASGWLFDRTASYTAPVLIAVVLSGIAVIAIRMSLPGRVSNLVENP